MFYIALALAVATAIGALYLRRGSEKSRSWEKVNGLIDERFAFVFLPSFAVVLFALALISAANLSSQIQWLSILLFAVGIPLAIVGAVGVFMGLFGGRYPEWLIPQWRRESPLRQPNPPARRRLRRQK